MTHVKSLIAICLETAAHNIRLYQTLNGIPEELAVILFQRVLELKKLTPRVVNMFKDTGWELVEHQIAALHLQDLPAFAPTPANPWLGDQRLI